MRKNLAKHTAKKASAGQTGACVVLRADFRVQLSAARLCKRHGRGA